MEKQKIIEIKNQVKLRIFSALKYCKEIGISHKSYHQTKTLLKIKDRNKIYKVQNEEPVIENKSVSMTINGLIIRLEEYSIEQLVGKFLFYFKIIFSKKYEQK